MAETRVLIAAAGAGTRAGLPYPKTLHPVQGVPILLRIMALTAHLDPSPTVVVSPAGEAPIAAAIAEAGRNARLVVQPEPRGMGDAVLCFEGSPARVGAEEVVLIWGDIPLIARETLDEMLAVHRETGADLTFPTRRVEQAYTVVRRDEEGRVVALDETRETGEAPAAGERDIGLFVFRPDPILDLLARDVPERYGRATGEHRFLHVVALAVKAGLRVEAPCIAREQDLVSLNRLSDLEGVA